MRKKVHFLLLVMSVSFIVPAFGQTESKQGDKYTLLTMPYINRPLNTYRGQLQVNAGYRFAVRSRSFDADGKKIVLKDDGNSSVLHYYFTEVKYGLTSFMEIGGEFYYMKRGIRDETISYISTDNAYTVNNLKEYKGPGDLFLYTALRLPFEYKWFDFGISGGIFLPTAGYKPDQPSHSITAESVNAYTINYHFNNKNGFGVPVYMISAAAKFTFSRLAFEAGFSIRDPLKEGTNIRWDQELTMLNTFAYENKPYMYLPDRTMLANASIHYQPVGWFNIYLGGNYTTMQDGWTEYYGLKYRNPEMHLFSLEPGFEIQISPTLILYQVAGIPLAGRNADASINFFTSLRFNMFLFRK
ncbi:MAG TPA: hypothetical protein PLV06_12810 [Bacteroidales bacterium]|nr:hypothetical protein [Bacteroidales bacterium]HPJ60903.1 hypothetical protein [Bacteroidales bacterium]HPR13261.1 hypothetical protein [Bacteroidales bacterium]HRW84948.1 hypothetical protein [Bacteroidales bacterium]